jgi:fructosamine-3-kinase
VTALASAIGTAVGEDVVALHEIAGGDVNRAFRVELADGRQVFVKHRADAAPGMYLSEAHGLAWLAAAGAIRLPAVIAAREEAPRLLALEWIAPGAPGPAHDEDLGRGLALLHRAGAPSFGLDRDNLIATVPQTNTPAATWAEFWATRRLQPLVQQGIDAGLLAVSSLPRWERLFDRMPELCGAAEPPARLHGDLWGGNAIVDEHGAPVLIDPAVYGGHREVDLAMMRLFGGFSQRVFAAYMEASPLADGHGDRVPLYQLGPLLVHLILFGGSYRAPVERVLTRYA